MKMVKHQFFCFSNRSNKFFEAFGVFIMNGFESVSNYITDMHEFHLPLDPEMCTSEG